MQAGIRRRWSSLALTLVLGYVVLVAGTMALEDRLIYVPTRGGVVRGPGQDVTLTSDDGLRLHARYLERDLAAPTLLYLHGNAGNLAGRSDLIEYFSELGANVLALDYRGYGQSEGSPSEAGLHADTRAAYEWLARRTPTSRIVPLGESLGGGPACELAATHAVGGLIVLAAFTSIPDMAALYYRWLPTRWLVRTRFDNLAKIERIQVPKLIIHSRRDEVVPFEMGERLFSAAPEPKQALWLDEAGHNDAHIAHEAQLSAAIRALLQRVAGP